MADELNSNCDLMLALALHCSCTDVLNAEIKSSSCLFPEKGTIGNAKLGVTNWEVIH